MKTLKLILGALLGLAVLAAATIGVVRAALLPETACAVSLQSAETIALERPYAEVRETLGCEGELVSREAWSEDLTREIYRWRGDAWPFGRVEGLFYNGVLHGKEIRWVTLSLDWPVPDEVSPAPANVSRPRP